MTIEKAIKYLEVWRECYRDSIDSCTAQAIGMAIEALKGADRPQGEWKPFDRTWGRETWYCTNCKDAVANMPTIMGSAIYKYCPNCGARMKGADGE